MIHYRTILLLACTPLFGQQYTISTIAGDGAAGVALYNPTGVAVDSAGNVYLADWSGFIRKIWAGDGATTIVAGTGLLGYGGDGGQATSAMLGKGPCIALDSAGNVYIADSSNNRIRRVDAATGIINTIAGTGAATATGGGGPATNAGIPQPSGVALDGSGNIYFGSGWDSVRKLTIATALSVRWLDNSGQVSVATTVRLSTLISGIQYRGR